MAHVVPAELQGLSLYRLDEKLCEKWAEVYPVWKDAYRGIDILYEIKKAHTWEVCNPDRRKTKRVQYLNNWLSRAHGEWHRRQQEQGLKFVGRHIPDQRDPVRCKTCKDTGLTPAKIKNRWGEEVPAMGKCLDCSGVRVAQ